MTGISYYAGKADCAQIMGGTNHHLSGHNNENCFGESCFWNSAQTTLVTHATTKDLVSLKRGMEHTCRFNRDPG